jgi:transcriptional regulator with XRE-family HTH domain
LGAFVSPEAITKQFARNLAEAREWAGLTQAEVARRAHVQQKDISLLENGAKLPRLDRIVALAEALEVQLRDLLFEIE